MLPNYKPKYKKALWKQIESTDQPFMPPRPYQIVRRTQLKRSQKPIPKESEQRKKRRQIYNRLAAQHKRDNPWCEACFKIRPGKPANQTEHTHHMKGRGKYYLDTTTFLAACAFCHSYIHAHPAFSYENGFMLKRV